MYIIVEDVCVCDKGSINTKHKMLACLCCLLKSKHALDYGYWFENVVGAEEVIDLMKRLSVY